MGDLFAPMHLIVIFAIVLVIFGPGKLPEVGSGLGKAIGNFKKGLRDGERQALEPDKKLIDASAGSPDRDTPQAGS